MVAKGAERRWPGRLRGRAMAASPSVVAALALDGRSAGAPRQDAEAVDVGGRGGGAAREQLRGDVGAGPGHAAGRAVGGLPRHGGDAEVEHLGAVVGEQDVAGLHPAATELIEQAVTVAEPCARGECVHPFPAGA